MFKEGPARKLRCRPHIPQQRKSLIDSVGICRSSGAAARESKMQPGLRHLRERTRCSPPELKCPMNGHESSDKGAVSLAIRHGSDGLLVMPNRYR